MVEDTDYGKSNAEYTIPLFEKDGWKVSSKEGSSRARRFLSAAFKIAGRRAGHDRLDSSPP